MGEETAATEGRITISVSQWAVPGQPTPSFVRLHCYSSPWHVRVWSGGRWAEGEQSTATPPPSTALTLPRFISPLPDYARSLSVQRPQAFFTRVAVKASGLFLFPAPCHVSLPEPSFRSLGFPGFIHQHIFKQPSLEIELAERSTLIGKELWKTVVAFVFRIPGL